MASKPVQPPSRSSTRPHLRTAPSPVGYVRPTVTFLLLLLVLSGVAYPGIIAGVAQLLTPNSAGGSILHAANGTAYGSGLLGQNITDPGLFWPRPAYTDYLPYNGSGNEVPPGPTDPALVNETLYYIHLYGLDNYSVPLSLVSLSASGLDPVLTPNGALIQVNRVSQVDHIPLETLRALVNGHIVSPLVGYFGPAYVNVLSLDVDLLKVMGKGPAVADSPSVGPT